MKSNDLVNNEISHLDLSILYYLNNKHNKLKVRKKRSTLLNIDEFKQQFFPSIKEKDFRSIIETMVTRQEIELDGEGMRLTLLGIEKYNKQDSLMSA